MYVSLDASYAFDKINHTMFTTFHYFYQFYKIP